MTETGAKTSDGFGEIADKGVAQVKVNYDKVRAAADDASDLLKSSYATATKGASDYNLKIFEIARVNTNTAFDYAHELLAVKTMSEFFELSTAHARKHFEAMTAQTKELATLAQKMTTDIAEPLKAGARRSL